ncbi:MAG TPA: glycosyltransferase family 39 protein [bacterium]|nr:glycosyltransferase family 39 protein [bacterium]
MSVKKIFYLLLLILITGFFHFKGINWGVPDKGRISSVFNGETEVQNLSELMRDAHEEIREMQEFYGAPYSGSYNPAEKVEININGKKHLVSREIINSMRSYLIRSYGADEQAVLVSLSKMNPSRFDFNPHFFEYGGAYLYPAGIFLKICSALKIAELHSDISFYFTNPDKIGRLYTLLRIFGGIFFIFSVICFYFLSSYILKDDSASFLVSMLFAISPVFVMWSHYLKPYCYGMLWVILALYCAFRFMDEKKRKWLIAGCLFSGISMGSILSYGYVFITFIFMIFLVSTDFKSLFKNILICLVCFLFSYFLTNPYVLISFKEFINEMFYIQSYWKGSSNFANLKYFMTTSLRYGLGTATYLISIVFLVVCFLIRQDRRFMLIFLSILPGFLYFGFSTGRWVHYAFILYPYIFVVIVLGMTKIKKQFPKILISIGILYTFIFSLSYVNLFSQENVRTSAGIWINNNIPYGSRIGFLEAPSPWRTPPFQFLKYNILIGASKETIKYSEYFVVSEYQWVRGGSFENIRKLLSDYKIIKEFKSEPRFFNLVFSHPESIPYDWCHPNPTILIWKRKNL